MQPHPVPAFKRHPFLRIAPPFILGIALAWNGMAGWGTARASLILSLVSFLTWHCLQPATRWAWKPLTGAASYALLFASGVICSQLSDPRCRTTAEEQVEGSRIYVLGIMETSITGLGTIRAMASVHRSGKNATVATPVEKVVLYVDPDSAALVPEVGDLIVCKTALHRIRNSGNPGAPDIAGWYAAHGLFWQASPRKGEWILLERNGPGYWQAMFKKARDEIAEVFRKYMRDSGSVALAVTLLTGYRTAMDPELLQAYSNTGVIHVIAISGLHLGLIHALLLRLLAPLFRRTGKPWLAGILALPLLWLFSFFTGASASVIRSAAMFTGLGIGASMGKRQSLLNGLPASAVVLLAFRPDWIADIGFQLSYAALLSIGLFQPLLRDWVRVTNPIAIMLRDLVSVTLAAQVLTAPLVAFHFHRLPLLFLMSNLVAVPLSSIILLMEISLCMASPFDRIAHPLGMCTAWLIRAMNGHVTGMDAVPHAGWEGLQPTHLQLILSYIAIAGIFAWWAHRIKWGAHVLLACLILISVLQQAVDRRREAQEAFIVFRSGRESLYAIVEGKRMLVLSDPRSPSDSLARKKTLRQAIEFFGVGDPTRASLVPGMDIRWNVGRKSWRMQCSQGSTTVIRPGSDTLCVLLSAGLRGLPDSMLMFNRRVHTVADASVPLWKIQQWKSSFEKVPSRFHSVPEQGAFLPELETIPRPAP
jgi:competence protein ComEC